jgi:cytoskeletal protein CcmA (bactofilin family)
MEQSARHDLKIFGVGRASGGEFNKVSITGQGDVEGNIVCTTFSLNGEGTINGSVKTGEGSILGTSTINGGLDADRCKIVGTVRVGGDANVRNFTIGGTVTIQGAVKCETLTLRGTTTVHGDCNAEKLECKGSFAIDGLVNAGKLDITLYGATKAKEIGGETVRVRKQSGPIADVVNALLQRLDFQQRLTADTIEGDEVVLEFTKARIVRGNYVRLGQGCEVDLVEYRGTLDQAPGAVVGEARKV